MITLKEHLETELSLVEQLIEHIDKSRLSAGILIIPEEFSEGYSDDIEETFEKELIEALTKPVEDFNLAASLIPIIIRGPQDLVDKIQHIDTSGDRAFRDMLCARAYTLKQRIKLFDEESKDMIQ